MTKIIFRRTPVPNGNKPHVQVESVELHYDRDYTKFPNVMARDGSIPPDAKVSVVYGPAEMAKPS